MGQIFNREKALTCLIVLATFSVLLSEAMQYRRIHRLGGGVRTAVARTVPPAIPLPAFFGSWSRSFVSNARPFDPEGLVRGIFLGDDSAIPPETRALFRSAGLSHLLAASGFNCWIVAAAFGLAGLTLLRLATGQIGARLELWLRRHIHPFAKLLGAWLFWSWTDQSPPITRSVALVSTQFGLELFGLRAPFARVLFVQYAASLLLVPRLWRSVSFQLTFGCLFGMILMQAISRRFLGKPKGWKGAVHGYFVAGVGASLGAAPSTFLAFGEVNFTGLLTNWFAVPIVSFGLMPVALLQMLLSVPVAPVQWLVGLTPIMDWLASFSGWIATILHVSLERFMSFAPPLIWHP